MHYDVIVAGAGPAGSTTARECASRGLRTLLLDRAVFPRDKPCGGGVTVRAARLLPFEIVSTAERTMAAMYITVRGQAGFVRRGSPPLTYLTQRRRLDAFLVEQALRAGAAFRDGSPVTGVEQSGEWLVVRVGAERYRARALVAADGANGTTARLAGLEVNRWKGIALEGNVRLHPYPERWSDVVGVDLGAMPGGYGWLFPKGDHVNVGVGGWSSTGPSLRRRLEALTRQYGLDPTALEGVRGHPLPVRRPGAPVTRGRVLAVGDAAGLLDPLSGEGIYSAFWSGITAARHLLALVDGRQRDLARYGREVEATLVAELHTSLQLRELFFLTPRLCAALVQRSSRAWAGACHIMTGDTTYGDLARLAPGVGAGIQRGAEVIQAVRHLRRAAGVENTPLPQGTLGAVLAALGR